MKFKPTILLLLSLLSIYLIWEGYWVMRRVAAAGKIIKKASPYTQLPETPKLQILVTGDSTGYGTGASRPEESVAGRLGSLLPSSQITNLSQNGMKSRELAAYFAKLGGTKYDLMVIHIGANDVLRLTPYSRVRQDIHSIMAAASKSSRYVVHYTSGNVGSAPFFPWFTKAYFSHRARVIRDIARAEAAKYPNVFYMDMYRDRGDDAWAQEPNKYYAADMLHPSSEGYRDWYEAMQKVLADRTDLIGN